jgi:hypothetical protein
MSKRIGVGMGISVGAMLAVPATAAAGDFQVTNLNDSGSGSLRQGLIDANTTAGADRVLFRSSLTGTIELQAPSLPAIDESLEIVGPGARRLAVEQPDPEADVFGTVGAAVGISRLTIRGGEDGILPSDGSALRLEDVTITGADESGISVVDSDVTVVGSALVGNGEEGMQLINGEATVENSTISGNRTEGGFELPDPSQLTLRNSTVTANNSDQGAGGIDAYGSQVALSGTIVAQNTGSGPYDDLEDELGSDFGAAFSLVGDPGNSGISNAGGNLLGVDPKLKPLKNNGGPTDTHAFKKSPAKNKLPKGQTPKDDQRGAPRKGKGDIGAYELVKCEGVIVNRVGTGKKDKLKGTKKADGILGLGGNDKLSGKKGKDGLCGGKGMDKLKGGPGKDKLDGGPGKDREIQ